MSELGQLAKKLNVSLQDLTMAEVIRCQTESPGEHLDQARIQLNDVLEMTEKATLNILDLVEQIREDCEAVRQQIVSLGPGEENWEEGTGPDGPKPTIWGEETKAFLAQLVAQGQELNLQLQAASGPAPSTAEPVAAPTGGLHFPLAEILQIVLEFCGNEALKQHLKGVIAKQGEIFRTQEAEAAFVKLAASQPEEDGFSQFPVEEVLKILHSTCEDKRFQDLFTKISASAGKLFPMPMLPLEGHPVEAAPAPAVAPAPQPPSFLPLWEDFFHKVQELAAQAENAPEAPSQAEAALEEAKIQETTSVLDRITASLSRIMEALAFQDLSGQRLLQVLKL
ncbi:MAG: protein phosphatase CheZ, partial [Deltaproteobacteria bacterium]|nr:protein phosphatase CheZ [Deltaproteobacteria bacterium]